MARPWADDARALRKEGVTAVVSLTLRPALPEPPPGLRVLHVPVPDMTAPSQEQLLRAVRFLREEVAAGGAVAVHCFAGIGRTGTVLAAWLVSEGREPDAAVAELRELRPGSLETLEQEHAVHLFAETWAREVPREERE